jgi:protein-S-isoprenylcysteine O-methyltransferase Ste14/pimeloyl-ACP methyl ester carboxylesterase
MATFRGARSLFGRALLAFLLLPGLIAFAVPLLLASPAGWRRPFSLIALVPLVAGLVLLFWCIRNFYIAGKGTLAPWDPPRNLVILGPYRRSRNPMYVAVGLVLLGWAIGFRSWGLLFYAMAVVIAFHLRVVFGEEPWLARTHPTHWERYAARVPRWFFPTRKSLVITLLALAAVLPLAGLIYEAYADAKAARLFPPPGMLVDVGGRRLHLVCIGAGEPTVIFEASGFGVSSMSSAAVREDVAAHTRVCSYDRMGMGWSDSGPGLVTSAALARDLAVLQDRAELQPPFILVASSIGGLTVEMFARQYAERVSGLVFLDAANSGMLEWLEPRFEARLARRTLVPALTFAARFGMFRLLDPFGIPTDSEEGRRSMAITYGARPIGALGAIVRGLPDSLSEFQKAPRLPADVRLIVLSSSDPSLLKLRAFGNIDLLKELRIEAHKKLAGSSTRGSWQMVPMSEHLIASSQPKAVTAVLLKMLAEIRAD